MLAVSAPLFLSARIYARATAGALTATAVAMTAVAGAPTAKDVPTNMRMRAFVQDQRTNHFCRGGSPLFERIRLSARGCARACGALCLVPILTTKGPAGDDAEGGDNKCAHVKTDGHHDQVQQVLRAQVSLQRGASARRSKGQYQPFLAPGVRPGLGSGVDMRCRVRASPVAPNYTPLSSSSAAAAASNLNLRLRDSTLREVLSSQAHNHQAVAQREQHGAMDADGHVQGGRCKEGQLEGRGGENGLDEHRTIAVHRGEGQQDGAGARRHAAGADVADQVALSDIGKVANLGQHDVDSEEPPGEEGASQHEPKLQSSCDKKVVNALLRRAGNSRT